MDMVLLKRRFAFVMYSILVLKSPGKLMRLLPATSLAR